MKMQFSSVRTTTCPDTTASSGAAESTAVWLVGVWGKDGATCSSSAVDASCSKLLGLCMGANLLVVVPKSVPESVTCCLELTAQMQPEYLVILLRYADQSSSSPRASLQ